MYIYNTDSNFTCHITPKLLHEVYKMIPVLATQIQELMLVGHRTGEY